ncbi:MAG: DUF4365 domain-containing protein [Cyanobacteriota bacterium]|nr:DUF4365 domain-containing protein [Cyanobacteriota bacterium]
MDSNIQKEEFSYAYIQALASTAGYAFQRTTTPLDNAGIDVTITGIGERATRGFPQLYLQVKSTSLNLLDDRFIKYPLRVKNYEELRKENQYPPLILVVVLMPEYVDDWLEQSSAKLCQKSCGYWISLEGEPPTENKRAVTVYLPRANLLTVSALKSLMQRFAMGEN